MKADKLFCTPLILLKVLDRKDKPLIVILVRELAP